jgi:hypothetical protein
MSYDEPLVSVPMTKAEANALLASWRCCAVPSICGARCMDNEESHRLAQFVAYIDNERRNWGAGPGVAATPDKPDEPAT